MSTFESSFLCGLIKKYKPHKILEVGVAAGATTALILNCIAKLELCSEMYSVDVSTEYYRNPAKKTGFVIDEIKPYLPKKVEHHLRTGDVVSSYLSEIGGGIDFLILDTMHALPGEVLDFLVCLPYLTENAIVVLHDVVLNHIEDVSIDYTRNAFATKLLFDTVVADKILSEDESRVAGFPNIAAFQCTPDTRKYIDDVFSSLTVTWFYQPEDKQLASYRHVIQRHYEEAQVALFDQAVRLNLSTLAKYERLQRADGNTGEAAFFAFHRLWKLKKPVVFFGAGDYGRRFYQYAKMQGLAVDAFMISDAAKKTEESIEGVPVYHAKELPYDRTECVVVLTVNEMHHEEILKMLYEMGFQTVFPPQKTTDYQTVCYFLFLFHEVKEMMQKMA